MNHEVQAASGLAKPTKTLLNKASLLILFCIWFTTQFAGIFSPGLLDDVDGIHMEAAREMALRHDYVTLYVDGIRYLDKPPLPYWMGTIAIRLLGEHDWAVRLSLALSVLALIFYIYWFGSRRFGERAGLYAGCAFSTAIGPYIFTRFFIPDVIVALWMTIAADLILHMVETAEAEGSARPMQAAVFAAVTAAAVLTKGLLGIVFPVGILFAFLVPTGRTRLILKLRVGLGTLVFLILAVPWHVLATIQNPASATTRGWFWFYFVNDQINRYLNKRIPHDYDRVPLLTFYALLIVWILPWGVFLAGQLREWWISRPPVKYAGTRFLLVVWVLLVLGFFSFSTRQEYYTLPAVPALALLIGAYLGDEESKRLRKPSWAAVTSGFLFGFGVAIAAACLYFAVVARVPHAGEELYEALKQHPEDYTLSFGHIFDLTAIALGFFRLPLICMAVSVLAATGVSFLFRLAGKSYRANVTLAAGMCFVLGSVHYGLTVFYPILGSKPLAQAINTRLRPDDLIVLDGEYSNGSSVNFYTRHTVLMLNGKFNNLWYGSFFPDAPQRFEDDASFEAKWNGGQRVFFITHDERRTKHWQETHRSFLLAESSGKFLLSNHADR